MAKKKTILPELDAKTQTAILIATRKLRAAKTAYEDAQNQALIATRVADEAKKQSDRADEQVERTEAAYENAQDAYHVALTKVIERMPALSRRSVQEQPLALRAIRLRVEASEKR